MQSLKFSEEGNETTKVTVDNKHIGPMLDTFFKEEAIIDRTKDCEQYFSQIVPALAYTHYPLRNASNLFEADRLHLAFSHVLHLDIAIFEVFMALMYRPWNSHCIYIDRKAPKAVHLAVHGIVRCYQNLAKQYPDGDKVSPV